MVLWDDCPKTLRPVPKRTARNPWLRSSNTVKARLLLPAVALATGAAAQEAEATTQAATAALVAVLVTLRAIVGVVVVDAEDVAVTADAVDVGGEVSRVKVVLPHQLVPRLPQQSKMAAQGSAQQNLLFGGSSAPGFRSQF